MRSEGSLGCFRSIPPPTIYGLSEGRWRAAAARWEGTEHSIAAPVLPTLLALALDWLRLGSMRPPRPSETGSAHTHTHTPACPNLMNTSTHSSTHGHTGPRLLLHQAQEEPAFRLTPLRLASAAIAMSFLIRTPMDKIKPYYSVAAKTHYTQLFQHFPFLERFYFPFEKVRACGRERRTHG